jgi:hypothetical protein
LPALASTLPLIALVRIIRIAAGTKGIPLIALWALALIALLLLSSLLLLSCLLLSLLLLTLLGLYDLRPTGDC